MSLPEHRRCLSSQKHGVLVLSLDADGGVGAARRAAVTELRRLGFRVGVAHYATFPRAPELSVPFWRLATGRPGVLSEEIDGVTVHRIGCRLPELEWRHHARSRLWDEVLDGYDHVMCVSGSILAAWPAVAAGRPCLAWIGTPYLPDRVDRARTFPWPRRIVDRLLDVPVCRRRERYLLERTYVAATGDYARRALEAIVPGCVRAMIPLPVAEDRFAGSVPEPRRTGPWCVGFAGRYDDPRKRTAGLLEAVALLRRRDGLDLRLRLVGGVATPALRAEAARLGIAAAVVFDGKLPEPELLAFYRSLDAFVIPSAQEGFAIVGAEAMAAGCPLVSTRCGGPEEYVLDGRTGLLTGHDPAEMAAAIQAVVADPALNGRLRAKARALARECYGEQRFRKAFGDCVGEAWDLDSAPRLALDPVAA
jgi:glycosyltransferase involved in cell wall biosynthesis